MFLNPGPLAKFNIRLELQVAPHLEHTPLMAEALALQSDGASMAVSGFRFNTGRAYPTDGGSRVRIWDHWNAGVLEQERADSARMVGLHSQDPRCRGDVRFVGNESN